MHGRLSGGKPWGVILAVAAFGFFAVHGSAHEPNTDLPGEPADPVILGATRAAAMGPCEVEGAACMGTIPGDCVENSTDGCVQPFGPCGGGTCTGPKDTRCQNENSSSCNETFPKCCRAQMACMNEVTGCVCRPMQMFGPMVGLRVKCD